MMENEDMLFVRNRCNGVEGDVLDEHGSVWDDRALLKAYDEALTPIKQELFQRLGMKGSDRGSSDEKPKKNKWKMGEACRAVYSEDGKLYEGRIKSINQNTGKCIVKYLGYGNEEEVLIPQLLLSAGSEAQAAQVKQAAADEENGACDNADSGESDDGKGKPVTRSNPKLGSGRAPKQHSFSVPNAMPSPFAGVFPPAFIPPPPPVHMTSLPANDRDALSSMLMSWYMSGFHTGYYQGLQQAKMRNSDKRVQD